MQARYQPVLGVIGCALTLVGGGCANSEQERGHPIRPGMVCNFEAFDGGGFAISLDPKKARHTVRAVSGNWVEIECATEFPPRRLLNMQHCEQIWLPKDPR